MPLTLEVDAARWRNHLKSYAGEHAGLVPVIKGNGYGFGRSVLAGEAASLATPVLAVGTYDELASVGDFPGETLVLSPWRPGTPVESSQRVVHTVSRLTDLRSLAADGSRPDVVVEVLTSMRRHGLDPGEIAEAAELLSDVEFRGWALHLPLAGDRFAEARRLADAVLEAAPGPLWISHLSPGETAAFARRTGADVRLRVGTDLWLGASDAFRTTSTVLDVHRLQRGDTFGYRQRRAWRDGHLVIVAGGTAHGIALQAPTPASTMRQRAIALANGGLEATGRALSPFTIAGSKRWFAEPPHMQCSMIWLPSDATPPDIGDDVEVDVRYTTTAFDTVRLIT